MYLMIRPDSSCIVPFGYIFMVLVWLFSYFDKCVCFSSRFL
jgi:hypothetical protein